MPKIAICDDEQPIREYLKSLTEKCIPDSQVRLFGSGEALLRDQTSFDVILLDVSLRGEDGNQTLNGMEDSPENPGDIQCDDHFCDSVQRICV